MKQYFALLTTDAQYADGIAALHEYSLANLPGGYTTQVIRTTTETNVVIVGAWVTESQINADSRLADMRLTAAPLTGQLIHEPTAFCRGRYMNLEQFRVFGFQLLGEGVRSSQGLSGSCFFIRQEKSGGHGLGTGKTPYDAANGWGDTTTLGVTLVRGNTYVPIGCNWAVRNGEAFAAINDSPDFPTGTGERFVVRNDFMANPGMTHLGFVDTTGTSDTWTQPVANPRVWKATYSNITPTSNLVGSMIMPIDPTLSQGDIYKNHLFGSAASQAEVEANPFTMWVTAEANGSDVWVHMPDDTDPTGRIARPAFGYKPKYMADPAKQDFDFINCQYIAANVNASGGMASGERLPKARWLGGRYMMGCTFKPTAATISGTEFGYSTDGDVVYDVSDVPNPATDVDIQTVINEHASDPEIWNQITRWMRIDSGREGVYLVHAGDTNNPDDGLMLGVYGTHIGDVHPEILAKFGNKINYSDRDAHLFGGQGCSRWRVAYVLCEKAGSYYNLYSKGDATTSQTMRDNILEDFIFRNSHNKYVESTNGAGINGLNINGDPDSAERTDGSGVKTGNIARRGVIRNLIGDPVSTIGDGGCLVTSNEQLVEWSEISMIACTHGIISARTTLVTTDPTYVRQNQYLGERWEARNMRFIEIVRYHAWMRGGVWLSTSPPNTGYVDIDLSTIKLPSGEDISTALKYRVISTEYALAGWQANVKTNPPSDEPNAHDPTAPTILP